MKLREKFDKVVEMYVAALLIMYDWSACYGYWVGDDTTGFMLMATAISSPCMTSSTSWITKFPKRPWMNGRSIVCGRIISNRQFPTLTHG